MEPQNLPSQQYPSRALVKPSFIDFLKSKRFSRSVIYFFIGLPAGYFIGIAWGTIAAKYQNLELGVLFLIFPILLIFLVTLLLCIYWGYSLGKELDYPQERESIIIKRNKRFLRIGVGYLVFLGLLYFLWPFLLFPLFWILQR